MRKKKTNSIRLSLALGILIVEMILKLWQDAKFCKVEENWIGLGI